MWCDCLNTASLAVGCSIFHLLLKQFGLVTMYCEKRLAEPCLHNLISANFLINYYFCSDMVVCRMNFYLGLCCVAYASNFRRNHIEHINQKQTENSIIIDSIESKN